MARVARVILPGTPHHVIQRGNRRQKTFFGAADYLAYLEIAAEMFARAEVEVWAYCLMPNHLHLIATPAHADGLAQAVGETHVRYTRRINTREGWTGFLWEGRFKSSPMDEGYLRRCVRYVGLNPVRAGLTPRARDWPWSSVRAHVEGRADRLLTREPVQARLGLDMAGFFDSDVPDEDLRALRRAATTGRPLGANAWVKSLENSTGRMLSDPPRGRPRAS